MKNCICSHAPLHHCILKSDMKNMDNVKQRQVNTRSSVPARYIITPVIFVVKVKWATEKPYTYVFSHRQRAENPLWVSIKRQECSPAVSRVAWGIWTRWFTFAAITISVLIEKKVNTSLIMCERSHASVCINWITSLSSYFWVCICTRAEVCTCAWVISSMHKCQFVSVGLHEDFPLSTIKSLPPHNLQQHPDSAQFLNYSTCLFCDERPMARSEIYSHAHTVGTLKWRPCLKKRSELPN